MPVMVVANRKTGVGRPTLATTLAGPLVGSGRARSATPCDGASRRALVRHGALTALARPGAMRWR
jgi:hypothetical protein